MQDEGTPRASAPHPKMPGAPRWMKVLLVVSLALNLLVVGAVVGAAVTGAGKWRGPGGPGGAGALTHALSEADRKALRRQMVRTFMTERDGRAAYRENMAELLVLLRAPEYDAAAVTERIAHVRTTFEARFQAGQTLLVDRLGDMSADERAAYADRLEAVLQRKKR